MDTLTVTAMMKMGIGLPQDKYVCYVIVVENSTARLAGSEPAQTRWCLSPRNQSSAQRRGVLPMDDARLAELGQSRMTEATWI